MLASSVLWKWVCWMCKNGAVVVGQVGSCRGYVMGWSVLGVARYGGCGLVGLLYEVRICEPLGRTMRIKTRTGRIFFAYRTTITITHRSQNTAILVEIE